MAEEQTATTQSAQPAETETPAAEVKTVLDGAADPADKTPAETQPAEGGTQMKSILDTQEPAETKPESKKPAAEPAEGDEAAKAEEEAYKALVDGIAGEAGLVLGKDAFGEEVAVGKEELAALYPALRKAGVPADKARDVASAFAAVQGAKLKAENERYVKAVNAKADECAAKFGSDLGRVKAFAVKGLNMMDKGLREELLATPVLVNDHRFLRFLAEVGEKFAIDDGGGAGAQGRGGDGGFDPTRWVNTSKRD